MYHCWRQCTGITTGVCSQCAEGYYGNEASADTGENTTCIVCEGGNYCTGGKKRGLCDAGHYCASGSSSPNANPCPPGTYGETQGLESSTCSGKCPEGYYCTQGTVTPTLQCEGGYFGNPGQSSSTCSGKCSAGYYCPPGSSSATANECGDASVYCPEQSSQPTAVQNGYYSTPEEAALKTGELICPKGHYCQNGIKYACPAGRYNSDTGQETCENKCRAGFFCPEGSKSPTANPCYPDPLNPPSHPAEYYCVEGTAFPESVAIGHFTTPEESADNARTGQELADAAMYTVRNGKRYLNIEWTGFCASANEGARTSVSVKELTNHIKGDATAGHQLTSLAATDNILQEAVSNFTIVSRWVHISKRWRYCACDPQRRDA